LSRSKFDLSRLETCARVGIRAHSSSGSINILIVTRVRPAPASSMHTARELCLPAEVDLQARRRCGIQTVTVESHSRSCPPNTPCQRSCLIPVHSTAATPSMKSGKLSKRVHRSNTTAAGTSISIDTSMTSKEELIIDGLFRKESGGPGAVIASCRPECLRTCGIKYPAAGRPLAGKIPSRKR